MQASGTLATSSVQNGIFHNAWILGSLLGTVALAAEMHVCRKVAEETGGSIGVCLDKAHLRDWLNEQCVPPPALKRQHLNFACEMVKMGFPQKSKLDIPTLVHATRDIKLLARTAYTCPQCYAKVSELPTDCVVCVLTLVLSPHLARSFLHAALRFWWIGLS